MIRAEPAGTEPRTAKAAAMAFLQAALAGQAVPAAELSRREKSSDASTPV